MVTNQDIYNALGPRGIQRSNNKTRGGLANLQGTKFENEFAVHTILNWLDRYVREKFDPATIVIGFQVPGFVDDLYVRFKGGDLYYELKSSLTQTWTKPLRISFRRQLHVLDRNRKKATLVLMVSSPVTARDLRRSARFRLKRVRVGSYIPDTDVLRTRIFRRAKHRRERSDLDSLLHLLIGIWRESSKKRTLVHIIERWNLLSHGNILRIRPTFVAGRELLDGIQGMKFDFTTSPVKFMHADLINGFIKYPVGSPDWSRLIEYLRLACPQNYMDFFNAYSTFVREDSGNVEV